MEFAEFFSGGLGFRGCWGEVWSPATPDPGLQPWVLCEGDGAHRDGPTADEFKPMGVLPEVSGNHPPLPKIFSGIFSGGLFRSGAI